MSEKCPFCGEQMNEPQPNYFAVYCTKPGCPLYGMDTRKTAVEAIRALQAEAAKAKPLKTARYWIQKNEDLKAENEALRKRVAGLDRLREHGWSVAVHNDYRQDGKRFTFWLFTNDRGHYIKGEGETDTEAIKQACRALEEKPRSFFDLRFPVKGIVEQLEEEGGDQFREDFEDVAIDDLIGGNS